VEREAIEQEVMRTGWEVDYGFSGHLIIGNAEDLSILTPSQAWRSAAPEYELYDAQRHIACRVEMIPTPLQARMLLEEHGEPAFVEEEE
jgi:signal transduction histidine kinase